MKLEGSLRAHKHRTAFDQDFLLFARLDYLQVKFLLGTNKLLHSNTSTPKIHESLLAVAGEILSLVTEAIVARDHLVNSGTGLVWKVSSITFHFAQQQSYPKQVAHYGLPAAGTISLSLLRPDTYSESIRMHKMVQNLGVFVAEVQGEGLVRMSGPDYALLHRAARTIDRILESLISGALQRSAASDTSSTAVHQQVSTGGVQDTVVWDMSATGDTLGCDLDFWRLLGEHPSLPIAEDFAIEPEWLDYAGEDIL